jgi:hypothetical protein
MIVLSESFISARPDIGGISRKNSIYMVMTARSPNNKNEPSIYDHILLQFMARRRFGMYRHMRDVLRAGGRVFRIG